MAAKLTLWLLLISVCFPRTILRAQTKTHVSEKNIGKYSIRIIQTPGDTVSVDDSARVRIEMYLDCTNKITRTETLFDDTSSERQRVILSVYGTLVTGPYRPMCAARRFVRDMYIHFPKPGDWLVEAGEPENSSGGDSIRVIIVR